MARIERAILSVTDKAGLVDFARRLAAMGVELISTGGTAKLLRESGITVKDISELTGFPEMLDGRVKTLHPKVHGGILHMRGKPEHRKAVSEYGIEAIDMVVVNLYAFEKTAAKSGVEFEDDHRKYRHRWAVDGALGRQEFSGRRHRDFSCGLRCHRAGDGARRRIALAEDEVAVGAEGVRHDRGLRFRDCVRAGAHRSAGKRWRKIRDLWPSRFPGDVAAQLSQGLRSPLRREPAPESCALLRRFRKRYCEWQTASGQGTQLQQYRRPASRVGLGPGV